MGTWKDLHKGGCGCGPSTVTVLFSGSFDGNANTSTSSSVATSASYALTASYALSVDTSSISISSSYALSSSYSLSASYAVSSSYSFSSSYASNTSETLATVTARGSTTPTPSTFSGGITGSLYGTASWALNVLSASYAISSSQAVSASYAYSASHANFLNTTGSDRFASTGSNIFRGTETITGSILLTGSMGINGSPQVGAALQIDGGDLFMANGRSVSVSAGTNGASGGFPNAIFRSSGSSGSGYSEILSFYAGQSIPYTNPLVLNNNGGPILINTIVDPINGSKLIVSGSVTVKTIPHQTTSGSVFLTSENDIIKYRSPSEILSDMGTSLSGTYLPLAGGTMSGAITSSSNIKFTTNGNGIHFIDPFDGSTTTAKIVSADGTSWKNDIVFYTNTAQGDSTLVERMRIPGGGALPSPGYTGIVIDMLNVSTTLAVTGNTTLSSTLTIGSIANDSSSNAFLTSASGLIKYRTAAQVASDIGTAATGVTWAGSVSGTAGSETLATVTGRGASTSTAVSFNGGLTSTTGAFSSLVQTTVADGAIAYKAIGSTGRLKIAPYYDATYGVLFQSVNTAENATKPMTFEASSYNFITSAATFASTVDALKYNATGVSSTNGPLYDTVNGGTNAMYSRHRNTGGDLYLGRDNSTGASFGEAYASILYSSGAYPMVFFTNGTRAVTINSSQVSSFTGGGSGLAVVNMTNSNSNGYGLDLIGGTASNFALRLRNYDASVTALTVLGNGTATFASSVTATGFIVSSDLTLKNVQNTVKSDDGIDMISWLWKPELNRDARLHLGYAAQTVAKILPDSVFKDDKGNLNVNIQEVQAYKIMRLEQRIAELEKHLKNK